MEAQMRAGHHADDDLKATPDSGSSGGRGFKLLDKNSSKFLDRDEIAFASIASLEKAFPAFEAGAIYVKCRRDEGWVRANNGLLRLRP